MQKARKISAHRLACSCRLWYTARLAAREIDLPTLDAAAHDIPSGMRVWEGRQERFDMTALRCFRSLKDSRRQERSLGTLGGGNHFIEVDRAADGTLYLVIHSGSRNLGKQVAEIYQQLAVDLHMGKENYFKARDEIIRTYKAAGRRAEIEGALKALKQSFVTQALAVPEDLCWLYGDYMADYLHDVEVCQRFAKRNREKMAEILLAHIGTAATDAFHTVHNYIDTEEMILRKGAVAAHAGERLLIPINMRDGAILAVGRGNAEWNFSAPHGAGRVMSRARAKETLDMEAYRASMAGVYTTSVTKETIDEAPMAYKSLAEIEDAVRDAVEVVEILKPIYNFKASDDTPPWVKEKRETPDEAAAAAQA